MGEMCFAIKSLLFIVFICCYAQKYRTKRHQTETSEATGHVFTPQPTKETYVTKLPHLHRREKLRRKQNDVSPDIPGTCIYDANTSSPSLLPIESINRAKLRSHLGNKSTTHKATFSPSESVHRTVRDLIRPPNTEIRFRKLQHKQKHHRDQTLSRKTSIEPEIAVLKKPSPFGDRSRRSNC
ncbi:hypothetical protein Bca4012_027554 [Brassica carinata]